MSRSSRVSPWSRRSLNSTVLWARASSLWPCISGSRAPTRGTSSASLLTFLPSPARRTFVNTLMREPTLPAAPGREPPLGLQNEFGLRAADLVFDPTLACREGDAPVPAARRCHRAQRHHADACRLVSARPRQPGTRRAGLTSKPHHAQRPQVALRGSFRLRLASTCNHRPARSPAPCYVVPTPTPRRTLPRGRTRPGWAGEPVPGG